MNNPIKTSRLTSPWGIFLIGLVLGCGAVYGPVLLSANSGSDGTEQTDSSKTAKEPIAVNEPTKIPSDSVIAASDDNAVVSGGSKTLMLKTDKGPSETVPLIVPTSPSSAAESKMDSAASSSSKIGSPLPVTTSEATTPNSSQSVPMETPPNRGVDSNLYMQTSAEYRACCIQAYRWAKRVIHDKVIARVALSASADSSPVKPPAVVLDLDETVLDNRQFQTRQIREGWAYNKDYWAEWEMNSVNQVGVIPGAVEFIQHLQTLGIQPIYITNRNVRSQEETLAALERFNIGVPTELLLCADENTKSNKDSRREKVREQFDVLMYVGDNLRDFDNLFQDDESLQDPATRIDARKTKVDENSSKLGEDWILLPNPAYGEWQKPLNKGLDDLKQLDPRLP